LFLRTSASPTASGRRRSGKRRDQGWELVEARGEEVIRTEPVVAVLGAGRPLAREEAIALSALAEEPFVPAAA
jgi:hypothetical protein